MVLILVLKPCEQVYWILLYPFFCCWDKPIFGPIRLYPRLIDRATRVDKTVWNIVCDKPSAFFFEMLLPAIDWKMSLLYKMVCISKHSLKFSTHTLFVCVCTQANLVKHNFQHFIMIQSFLILTHFDWYNIIQFARA